MKKALILLLITSNSYAYTVIDSFYEEPMDSIEAGFERVPASEESKFCLVDDSDRKFAKSCYSSMELCEKRLDFWKDLPGVKPSRCANI